MDETGASIEIIADRPWFVMPWQRLSISIDGRLARLPWSHHVFEVHAGEHVVEAGTGSAFSSKAVLRLVLAAGEVRRLRYVPRIIKNVPGKLVDERLPPARLVR